MPKIHIITDADLDGAGSFLCLKYAYENASVSYSVTTEKNFLNDISYFKFNEYDLVIISDLNLKQNEINLCDFKNVIIIDHHKEHIELIKNYKNAKPIIKDYTSCTKLIFDTFKLESKLNKNQKLLIKLIDDYDSYTLSLPFSKPLNQVFWSYTGDRIIKFENDFNKGFFGFNQFQKNALKITQNKIERFFKEETIYKGNLRIGGNDYNVAGVFISFSPNEIAERIIEDYKVDFVIQINLKGKAVYMRRSKNCTLNLGKLASKLMDGGGHNDAAGGTLNESIINITKFLKPINEI
jgi:oligoribonuclease NrnB/cAMP/cGMP phosphodiesterase (DHH superfamily)